MCVCEELKPSHWTRSPCGQNNDFLSPLTLLPQPGQHPPQSGDGPGPGETNPPWDCQQQWTPAHAEHQRRFPVPENTPPPHRWRETQQGAENIHTLALCDSRDHYIIMTQYYKALMDRDPFLNFMAENTISSIPVYNSFVRMLIYDLSTHCSHTHFFWSIPARRPSCSRHRTTSLPWSRKRHSFWHRTTSSNVSSR